LVLRLAETAAAAIRTVIAAAIGVGNGWDYESIKE